MEIKDLIKPNTVFHCDTEEKANELLNKAHDLGYKWCSGDSYLDKNNFDYHKEDTCYDIYDGRCIYINYYRNRDYKIIEYILDKDLEEKSMDRIIDGKDLVNMKFIKDSEGRLMEYKALGKYIPKRGDDYYFIDDYGDVICDTWEDCENDKWRLKHYKLFRTEKECEDYKWFLEQVDKYSYEFSHEEWKDDDISKYTIEYNYYDDDIDYTYWNGTKHTNAIYFKSEDDREKFVYTVGKFRIKKYMFDILD